MSSWSGRAIALGRNLRHLIGTLEEFQQLGVAVIILRDGLDLSTAARRLQMAVIGAIAQFERDRLRERTAAADEDRRGRLCRAQRDGRTTFSSFEAWHMSDTDTAIAELGDRVCRRAAPGNVTITAITRTDSWEP